MTEGSFELTIFKMVTSHLNGNSRRKGFKTSEETKKLLSISSSRPRNLKEVECPYEVLYPGRFKCKKCGYEYSR
jgi:hypothetical protein